MKHCLSIILLLFPLLGSSQLKEQPGVREKVELIINTDFLITGETLLYSVRCSELESNSASVVSSVAYVELIDSEATPVVQSKVHLVDGNGSGEIFIPSSFVSGNYKIIAYTQWLRNWGTETFFQKELTIVNPYRAPEKDIKTQKLTEVQFFPEGGALIAGVENRVLCYVSGSRKGKTYKIRIQDDEGNAMTELMTNAMGIGTFSFRPDQKQYKAVLTDENEAMLFAALPVVKAEGVTVTLDESQTSFNFVVGRRNLNAPLLLNLFYKGQLIKTFPLDFSEDDQAGITILKNELPSDVLTAAITNGEGAVLASRSLVNVHYEQNFVELSLSKQILATRESLEVKIQNLDTINDAQVSVNVQLNEPELIDANDIRSNLTFEDLIFLTKELQIDPNLFLIRSSQALTPVMHTKRQFLPDLRGQLIAGKFLDESDRPVANAVVFLSSPAQDFSFQPSKTDSSGQFFFNISAVNGKNGVFVVPAKPLQSGMKISVEKEFLGDYSSFQTSAFTLDTLLRKSIEVRNIYSQIENAYFITNNAADSSNPKRYPFYGRPDKIYRLDDFTRFPTMEDVFREYVPEVVVTKRKEEYTLQIVNTVNSYRFPSEPLLLIDGVPVYNTAVVMNYDPANVMAIEIVARRYYYGPAQFDGIISFKTYNGRADNLPIIDRTPIGIKSFEPKNNFLLLQDRNGQQHHIPDFRTNLYWNPNITLRPGEVVTLKLSTSDVPGDFAVRIHGFRNQNSQFYLEKKFSVSAPASN